MIIFDVSETLTYRWTFTIKDDKKNILMVAENTYNTLEECLATINTIIEGCGESTIIGDGVDKILKKKKGNNEY